MIATRAYWFTIGKFNGANKYRVVGRHTYVEILRAATDAAADLILLGVHGRKLIDVAMFGSTTNHVVRRATSPVMTLRR